MYNLSTNNSYNPIKLQEHNQIVTHIITTWLKVYLTKHKRAHSKFYIQSHIF